MKKSHQKRARKLAKRPAPKARGRSGRTGVWANAWKAKPLSGDELAQERELSGLITAREARRVRS